MRLRDALSRISTTELHALATYHRIKVSASPMRYELMDALARHLYDGQNIKDAVQSLTVEQRSALNRLISEGGRLPTSVFERDYGAVLYGDIYDQRGFGLVAMPHTPAQALFMEGLIYRGIDANGSPTQEIVIPDEILALLPRVKKLPFAEMLTNAPDPNHIAVSGDAIRDVGMLLCYLQRETVRAIRVDRLAKRDLVRINQHMSLQQNVTGARSEEEAPWIAFVHHLAQMLDVIKMQGGVISPSDKAENWLHQTREQQTLAVWRGFIKDGTWNDIEQAITASYLYSHPSQPYIVATRALLLDNLKQCPPGRWLTIDSFESAVRTHSPQFMRSMGANTSWSSWSMSYFYGGWANVEGPFVHHVLEHTLRYLGVIEVGRTSADAAITSFRITELGALLLGSKKGSIAQPASASIIVQPNFEIVTPSEVSPAVLYYLQQMADLAKTDRASIYTLSQNAIWRNLQAGGNIEHIISFLEKTAQRPLPQNVAYSLREWGNKHGELTIDQVTLLTASSDALMAEVRANKKTALAVTDTISPRAVTIANSDISAVIERLKKAGYWPKTGKGIMNSQASGDSAGSTINIKQNDLAHLLVAAMVAHHIADDTGWHPPIAESLIRNLTWNLPPAVVKQVQRLASQAIDNYESAIGEGDDPDDDE